MEKPQRHKELETILILVMALGICYWLYRKQLFLLAALILGVTGLLLPVAAKAIHRMWMKIAEGMGFVMNRVIFAAIFIFIVVPFGWLSKKAGKSSVRLKPGGPSYFKHRDHVFTKEDMEKPW